MCADNVWVYCFECRQLFRMPAAQGSQRGHFAYQLCQYAVLSVVFLQNMLEGQLDLLLEFLHLHLLLEPGSVGRHQDEGGEQGDLVFREVHRTQVFPKLEDRADQVVAA